MHGLDPQMPGRALARPQWDALWDDLVDLLTDLRRDAGDFA